MFGTMPSNIIDICTVNFFMKPTITSFLPNNVILITHKTIVKLEYLKRFRAWYGTRMNRHYT